MSFVLDSSITMSWLLQDESNPFADHVRNLLDSQQVHVPVLWLTEVINVLRQARRRNRIPPDYESWSIDFLKRLPISIDTNDPWDTAQSIQSLAMKHNLTAYDAAYLELALRLEVPLATLDKDLASAARSEKALLTLDA